MGRRAAAMITLLALSACVYAQDAQEKGFEFKGIVLGSDLATLEATKRFDCEDSDNLVFADQQCFPAAGQNETIAGVLIQGMVLSFYDSKLQTISIYFDVDNFKQVIDALAQNTARVP